MTSEYETWLAERTERTPDKLGGRRCFKGRQLSVWYIGGFNNVDWALSLYPYLSKQDVIYARRFKREDTRKWPARDL